jgi:hypothetical protein
MERRVYRRGTWNAGYKGEEHGMQVIKERNMECSVYWRGTWNKEFIGEELGMNAG